MPRRFYVDRPFEEPGVYIADADTTALIAKLYEANPLEVELGRSLTTEQNAKLLAAAPELLAALQRLEKRLTDCANAFYVAGSTKALRTAFEGWKDDIQPARDAIAKTV